ncbi:MAG: TonB-dependent receptor [Lacunisphaera sp.]|nr:TonB-dependent receptor [Lacunisphaera sp.]
MNTNLLRTLLAVLFAASVTGRMAAQTAPAAAPAAKEEILELDKFSVRGVAPEQQIMPTSRPFNSVFGTDDNIIDVPRNVTIISRQQLSDINISSVLDFAKLTSSSYTTTNFGAPSNPSIRAQTADLFINGVRGRITSNGNGLPLDFNSVESVNIVKGPATAVQGASMYVGGFVDLVTKRPYFDGFKGSVSATIGSYSQKEWTIDVGGPVSKELAYRFSYSGTDSKGFWWDYYNKNHSLYGALIFRPTEKYEVFFNASASFYRYTENWGMNRPTQALIDHLLYITGTNVNGGTAATAADPQNAKNVGGTTVVGNTIAFGAAVPISRHNRLLKPSNHSVGREFNMQAIQTFLAGPDLKVVNNTFWSYTARNTLSTYYYSEIIDPSWFAENRTEFIITKPFVSLNAGLDLRYQRTLAYDDYSFEPANAWDLTKDHNFIDVYKSVNFPAPNFFDFGADIPVPGWPGRYGIAGTANGDTNDSHGTTFGPFAQATWKVSGKLNLVTGARFDYLKAHVREPLKSTHPTADISITNPNYNASLVYKMSDTASAYVTYNYSKNISGAVGNGGGITGWNGAGTALDKENFQQPATLFEAGTKYALLKGQLFFNLAYFQQKRTAKTTSSTSIVEYKTKGVEVELNYQPNKHLYATASYSYIDAKTAGFQFQYGMFGGTSELTGGEAITFAPETRTSGVPRSSFNGLVSYTFDNGFGFSTNALVTSPINNNVAATLVIPWQYEIDASLNYKIRKEWEFRLSVGNVTDRKNWAPPNSVYGNGSILALAGTTFSLNVKYNY